MGSGQIFVLSIIAMSTVGWIITTWVRARHGYPIENEWSGTSSKGYDGLSEDYPSAVRKIELLATENGKLLGQLSRLEERIAVLERIATDPAERVARDIDALR